MNTYTNLKVHKMRRKTKPCYAPENLIYTQKYIIIVSEHKKHINQT